MVRISVLLGVGGVQACCQSLVGVRLGKFLNQCSRTMWLSLRRPRSSDDLWHALGKLTGCRTCIERALLMESTLNMKGRSPEGQTAAVPWASGWSCGNKDKTNHYEYIYRECDLDLSDAIFDARRMADHSDACPPPRDSPRGSLSTKYVSRPTRLSLMARSGVCPSRAQRSCRHRI